MEKNPDRETILAALEKAKSEKSAIEKAISHAKREAEKAIELEWKDRLHQRRQAIIDAEKALHEHDIAAASQSNQIGLKVSKRQNKSSVWSRTPVYETIYGVIEVRTYSTTMPGNLSDYRMPRIGALFVRLLKADGSVGMKIDSRLDDWTPVEEA